MARRLSKALFLLFLIITLGTAGYMLLEGLSFLDALYMTVITVSTVGFREVTDLSLKGRVFTIFLIIFGVGVLFYTLGVAVEFMIERFAEGALKERRKMKKLARIKGHFIVCGFGRVGREIARGIKNGGEECVVIESREERCKECEEEGYLCVLGDASKREILQKAGIERAKGLAAAVDTDADNIFVVLAAREVRDDLFIVARANTDEGERRLKKAGANQVISPNIIGGKRMANLLLKPLVFEYVNKLMIGEGGEFELDEALISPGSKIAGLKLAEAGIREHSGALVLAVKKGKEIITNPPPKIVLEKGDKLVILGTSEQLRKARDLIV